MPKANTDVPPSPPVPPRPAAVLRRGSSTRRSRCTCRATSATANHTPGIRTRLLAVSCWQAGLPLLLFLPSPPFPPLDHEYTRSILDPTRHTISHGIVPTVAAISLAS